MQFQKIVKCKILKQNKNADHKIKRLHAKGSELVFKFYYMRTLGGEMAMSSYSYYQ